MRGAWVRTWPRPGWGSQGAETTNQPTTRRLAAYHVGRALVVA
jgi:hypothetical protein